MKYSGCIRDYLCRQFNLPQDQIELMLPKFKKTLATHMENLEKVHRQDNLDDLQKAAHTIKGAFLNLGLADCAELAMKIEGGAANNDSTIDYAALIDNMGIVVHTIVNE